MRHAVQTMGKATTLLLLLMLGACAGTSDLMRNVPPEQATYAPKPDKALIVFMRPSSLGFAVQSTVYDITDGNPDFIAVVSAKKKVAHYAEPGDRRFMVIGESADFMDAKLDPGKVYYALVTPRMGLWKARFSLRPVHSAELKGSDFDEWFGDCNWVETQETATTWAAANMGSIKEKMADDLSDWKQKPDKPVLYAADGEPDLYKPMAKK